MKKRQRRFAACVLGAAALAAIAGCPEMAEGVFGEGGILDTAALNEQINCANLVIQYSNALGEAHAAANACASSGATECPDYVTKLAEAEDALDRLLASGCPMTAEEQESFRRAIDELRAMYDERFGS